MPMPITRNTPTSATSGCASSPPAPRAKTTTPAEPIGNPSRYDDWIPRDNRFDDGGFVTTDVGTYQPNAWGLHDMIGNAWEWTADTTPDGLRVARGGSWRDRPHRATVNDRVTYPPHQRVFNVGFRVVLRDAPPTASR
jgi:formylglycine-generating enzyme required for sulfatase activity